MSILTSIFGSGKKAAKEAIRASEIAAKGQQQGLDYITGEADYMKQFRNPALEGLSSFYQSPIPQTQEELIAQAKSSPLYAAILGSRKAGEDSITRNASATGMLRSGNTIAGLSDYNMNLENRALLESYNQQVQDRDFRLSGLAGLSGLPTYTGEIAGGMAGIADTRAKGVLGAAQTREAAKQNAWDNAIGIGKIAAVGFSDIRLKSNIQFKGYRNGYPWYSWEWIHEAKEKLGLSGKSEGVIAHQVYETNPDAIGECLGFLTVDYSKLGVH